MRVKRRILMMLLFLDTSVDGLVDFLQLSFLLTLTFHGRYIPGMMGQTA